MLKLNAKETRAKIKDYIMANFLDYCEDNKNYIKKDIDITDYEQVKDFIVKVVFIEKNKKWYKTLFEMFRDYAQGLPSIVNCDYYYNVSAVELLGDILEETEQERNRYTETKAQDTMTYLLYKELDKNFIKYMNETIKRDELFI